MGPWRRLDSSSPLPEGPLLVWAAAPDVPRTLAALLALLPEGETALASCPSPRTLEDCARALAQSRIGFLYPHLEAPKALFASSLASLRLQEREEKARELARVSREEQALKAAESGLQEELAAHRTLVTLESNLEALRDEIAARKPSWFSADYGRAEALAAWERAGAELARTRSGLRGLITGRLEAKALEAAEQEAASRLSQAERAAGAARREREEFVRDARTLREELLEARSRAARLRPLAEAEAALATLRAGLADLRERSSRLARESRAAPSRPLDAADLEAAPLILAREGADRDGPPLGARRFDDIVAVAPPVSTHRDREALVAHSAFARRRFIVLADFSACAWYEEAPVDDGGAPAWHTLLASEPLPSPGPAPTAAAPGLLPAGQDRKGRPGGAGQPSPAGAAPGAAPPADLAPPGGPAPPAATLPAPSATIAAALVAMRASSSRPLRPEPPPNPLGPYPAFRKPDGGSTMRPSPSGFPGLLSVNIQDGLAICPVTLPEAVSLRARGEDGPVNPVTAFTAVRLAATFLEGEDAGRAPRTAGPGGAPRRTAVILAPSPAQARLLRALLEDLGKAHLRVLAGEPGDFEGFPPASLVILDTALGAPHASHPWAKAPAGAKALLLALSLAGGALVLLGPERRIARLPAEGPLAALYRAASDKVHADAAQHLSEASFQEALEAASASVFCSLPAQGPDWWRATSPGLLGAIRRGARVTVLAAPPGRDGDGHPEEALRGLRVAGGLVLMAEGFPAFTGIVDRRRLFWGDPAPPGPGTRQRALALDAPRACAALEEVLQLPLIEAKLAPGPSRSCPLCGWPFLLVNRDRPRGFGDTNPLKLACLNPSCQGSRSPRPLHERWPYPSPPLCRVDGATPYGRVRIGKKEFWICPTHPEGGPCPRSRVVPGDPPERKRG
jgi:hypothetical protein